MTNSPEGALEYRASLFAQRPLGYLASALLLLAMATLLSAHAHVAATVAIGFAVVFVARLRARRIIFGDDSLDSGKRWVGLGWFPPQAHRAFAERFIRKKSYVVA